jgi:hypothetical protein
MVDDVLADLARVGHTPRIVEEVESTSVDPSRQPAGSVENTDVLARIPGGRP